MNITFVAPRFHTNQLEAIKILMERKHKVSFLVSKIGFTEDYSLISPIKLDENVLSKVISYLFGAGINNKNYFPRLNKIKDFFNLKEPDLLVIRKHGFFFTYLLALIGFVNKSRIVFYGQISPEKLHYDKKSNIKSILRKIYFTLILSIFDSILITPVVNKTGNSLFNRVFYVPFAYSSRREKETISKNKLRILMVGKYQSSKSHHILVESVKDLPKKQFTLTLVGEVSKISHLKYRKFVQSKVIESKLQKNVFFLDNIKYDHMKEIYANHDMFVLPSIDDPAPFSSIEALSYGLPVICTKSGTSDYVEDGINGFVLDNCDSLKIRDKILSFILNEKKYKTFSDNAIRLSLQNTSPERYIDRFNSAIQDSFNIKL